MYYTALCVSGQYYSVLNEECRNCPENSEGMESGLSECPCVERYYRASGEEDLPCTRKFIILIHAKCVGNIHARSGLAGPVLAQPLSSAKSIINFLEWQYYKHAHCYSRLIIAPWGFLYLMSSHQLKLPRK